VIVWASTSSSGRPVMVPSIDNRPIGTEKSIRIRSSAS
jgi:hypothetical protein